MPELNVTVEELLGDEEEWTVHYYDRIVHEEPGGPPEYVEPMNIPSDAPFRFDMDILNGAADALSAYMAENNIDLAQLLGEHQGGVVVPFMNPEIISSNPDIENAFLELYGGEGIPGQISYFQPISDDYQFTDAQLEISNAFIRIATNIASQPVPSSTQWMTLARAVEEALILSGFPAMSVANYLNTLVRDNINGQSVVNQIRAGNGWGAITVQPFQMVFPEDNGRVVVGGQHVGWVDDNDNFRADTPRLFEPTVGYFFETNGVDINLAVQEEDPFDLGALLQSLMGGGRGAAEPVYVAPDEGVVKDLIRQYMRVVIGEADEPSVNEYLQAYKLRHRAGFDDETLPRDSQSIFQVVKELVRKRDDYKRIHRYRPSALDEEEWVHQIIQNQIRTGINPNRAVREGQSLARQGQTFGDPVPGSVIRGFTEPSLFERAGTISGVIGAKL